MANSFPVSALTSLKPGRDLRNMKNATHTISLDRLGLFRASLVVRDVSIVGIIGNVTIIDERNQEQGKQEYKFNVHISENGIIDLLHPNGQIGNPFDAFDSDVILSPAQRIQIIEKILDMKQDN